MKNSTLTIIVIAALVILVGILVSKKDSSEPAKDEGPIKVGMSLPLTGEAASLGQAGRAAAEMAAKEINDAGGIKGRQLQLVIEDDKCSKEGVTVITKLINIDKVPVIIGPMCSPAAGPGLPVAQAAGVPTLFWASAPALASTGNFVFRAYPSDTVAGEYIANYAVTSQSAQRLAVLYVKNDWGQGVRNTFVKKATELNATIVFDDSAVGDSTDFRSQLTKLKATNPDVIYMPLYPKGTVAALKQMKELGMTTPVISGEIVETDEVLKSGYAKGLIYHVPKVVEPEEFKTKLKTASGLASNIFAPLAYDGVKIVAKIIGEVGTDRGAIRKALENLNYTESVAYGTLSFDKTTHEMAAPALQLKRILDNNGTTEVIP